MAKWAAEAQKLMSYADNAQRHDAGLMCEETWNKVVPLQGRKKGVKTQLVQLNIASIRQPSTNSYSS